MRTVWYLLINTLISEMIIDSNEGLGVIGLFLGAGSTSAYVIVLAPSSISVPVGVFS